MHGLCRHAPTAECVDFYEISGEIFPHVPSNVGHLVPNTRRSWQVDWPVAAIF